MPVVDLRSGARMPSRSGVLLVTLGALVTHQLEGVAAFDQRDALGGEALQLDRLDLGAILLLLAALLRQLVIVQLALDPLDGAMEEVDRRPEQVLEVGFDPGVGQRHDQRIEDVGDGAGDMVAFGERPWIWIVREGSPAIELEFGEDMVGRG